MDRCWFNFCSKYPEVYEAWRFITVFTRAHHLSVSWARSIQSTPLNLSVGDSLKYHLPIYACIFLEVYFPQVSSPKPFLHLSTPQYVPHAPPILFFLILSPEKYLLRCKNNEDPQCPISSIRLWNKNLNLPSDTSSNATDLYSGDARFESPFRHRQFRDFFVFFLSSTIQML